MPHPFAGLDFDCVVRVAREVSAHFDHRGRPARTLRWPRFSADVWTSFVGRAGVIRRYRASRQTGSRLTHDAPHIGGGIMVGALLMSSILTAGTDSAVERLRVLSEKLALELRDSRHCEVNPDNGYVQCHYQYKGLRFVRRTLNLPTRKLSFVNIESLEPGNVGISIHDGGPCFSVNITADRPEDVAAVFVNVKDGRISADGRAAGCFSRTTRK